MELKNSLIKELSHLISIKHLSNLIKEFFNWIRDLFNASIELSISIKLYW